MNHEGAAGSSGRRARSLDFQDALGTTLSPNEAKAMLKSQAASEQTPSKVEKTPSNARGNVPPDMDLMKEKFAKLLLGEDMSASVWGEQNRLEPMSPKRKARWRKEIEWLLSVTDYIVEFVPSQQITVKLMEKGGIHKADEELAVSRISPVPMRAARRIRDQIHVCEADGKGRHPQGR